MVSEKKSAMLQTDNKEPLMKKETSNSGVSDEGLERFPDALGGWGIFGGIMDDFERRAPHYLSDFTDGFRMKTVSATLYMWFNVFSTTVALGELLKEETDGYMGVTEYLLITSVCGMAHALIAGQPLLVLRPTGPITAITIEIYNLSSSSGGFVGMDFNRLLAWTGIFTGIFMCIIAAIEFSRHIKLLTRFTYEMFSFFVCTIPMVFGLEGMASRYDDATDDEYADALLSTFLTLTTVGVALFFYKADQTNFFNKKTRDFLVDYGLTFAILLTIAISYGTGRFTVEVSRVELPDSFEPTNYIPTDDNIDIPTRGWYIYPFDINSADWLVGLLAAIPVTIFFYLDQNISCLLTQIPEMHLQKGHYYHSTFLCMGIFNIVGPCFGLPYLTGSLPQSPQFVLANSEIDRNGKITKVHENRIAPFFTYLLIGLPIFVPEIVEVIPNGAVDGILIYIGLTGLFKSEFYERLFLLFTEVSAYPKDARYTQVPIAKMHLWTFIQVVLLGVAWGVNSSPAALGFPLVIAALIPFRFYVLPRWFTEYELEKLDGYDDEDAAEESSVVVNMRKGNRSLDRQSFNTDGRGHSRDASLQNPLHDLVQLEDERNARENPV